MIASYLNSLIKGFFKKIRLKAKSKSRGKYFKKKERKFTLLITSKRKEKRLMMDEAFDIC